MSDSDIYRTTGPGAVSRRGFLKLGAAGTVGAVGLGGAGPHVPSATGESEAAVCGGLCILGVAGGIAAGGAAVGWALREYEVLGSDSPPEGLTPGALIDEFYNATQSRTSQDQSTFIDNENIVKAGVENAAYGDGKIAAIEELNNEAAQADVEAAATSVVEDYETTVKLNLLKSWNETVRELHSYINAIEAHTDLAAENVPIGYEFPAGATSDYQSQPLEQATRSVTMPDGTSFDLETISAGDSYWDWDPMEKRHSRDGGWFWIAPNGEKMGSAYTEVSDIPDYEPFQTLNVENWMATYSDLNTAFQNAKDGLLLWVDNIYSQVQAGELNTEDLLTERELAAMTADQEDYNQAIADLMALNISVDLEREAEIYLPNDDVTLYGSLGVTQDTTLEVGTIDPTADDMDYYLTYDVSQGEGVWSDYTEGIDGGTVTFTSEPYQGTQYDINTTAGETATVSASEFTETEAGGEWTVDVSDQLETTITNIDSVTMFSETSETEYQTIQLEETFEIVTFTDSDGNEYDSADHTSSEPHDDTNYITEEEWEQRQQRYEELIEKYEESKNSGGGGGILPDDLGGSTGMLLLVLAGGAAVLGLQGDN